MKNTVAIVDVGSTSIVSMIGQHGVNNTFNVCGKGEIYYAGFQNAEFLEPQNLKLVIANSVSNAEISGDKKIYEVYVGVPGEFCTCVTKSVNLTFPKYKKITQFDVDNIFATGNDFEGDPMFTVINKSVIYYEIDGVKRVIDPVGIKAKSVTGFVSFILARKAFTGMFKSIFAELKIMVKGFICANLAEGLYLFDGKTRDKYSILVDVGYITTNVAIFRGNGLLSLNSFSMGGGFITADLAECLKISFNEAERIKHKIVLGWKAGVKDVYEIDGADGYIQTYSASAVNEISTDRIEMICDYIQKCFDSCVYALPDFLPVNITGGGFNFIKGIKPIVANKLKRKINFVAPSYPNINGPDYSSEVGLLHMVLQNEDLVHEMLEI